MTFNGTLTEQEVLNAIENSILLRTMKNIVEDEVYTDEQKYVILEGILSTWGIEK